MATIVFASSKGGVGKSTSALLLATTLAKQAKVALIDADPNNPLERWAARRELPENLTVISRVGDDEKITKSTIMTVMQRASSESDFVVVDLEGAATTLSGFAIAHADLVIAPMAASQIEVDEAERIVELIALQEQVTGRTIPFRILFTRTPSAIKTRSMGEIQKALDAAGLPRFETHLINREAFRVLFTFGGTLDNPSLGDVVSNVPKAQENAHAYAQEVVNTLKEVMK